MVVAGGATGAASGVASGVGSVEAGSVCRRHRSVAASGVVASGKAELVITASGLGFWRRVSVGGCAFEVRLVGQWLVGVWVGGCAVEVLGVSVGGCAVEVLLVL
jgi:hypothetical protein